MAALTAATATVLTNAYYLRFLEPRVSRAWAAALVVVAAGAALVLSERGAPRGKAAWLSLARGAAPPILLALVVSLAFVLRAWGANAGLPQSYVSDEYEFVHDALRMMKGGDLSPHTWYHPTLQPYVALATYSAVFLLGVREGRWVEVKQVTEEDMLYWGRFVGVVSGTLTVLVAFLLGRRLSGPRVGLLAAALLAVFPAAVEHSQYNKPDPLLGLMTALSVLVALAYLDRGGRGWAVGAGLAIGLTLATKYNGIVVVVPFLLAVAFRHGWQMLARPDLYLGGLGIVAGFFLGCPLFLANLPLFLDHVADDIHAYATGRPGSEGDDNWANHARYIARDGAGYLPALAGVAGLGLALWRMNARLAVFLSFPLFYYGYYSAQRINFRANLLPVFPFLAVLAAYAVEELVGWLQARWRRPRLAAPLATAALLTVLLGPPLIAAVRYDVESTRRDTGSFAREWIERTVPAGTRIALERFTPVLDRSRYPVTQETRLITRSVRSYRAEGVQYLVVSSLTYDRYAAEHNQSRSYQKLFAICPLVAEFAPIPGQRPGPTIRVLRVPDAPPDEGPVATP